MSSINANLAQELYMGSAGFSIVTDTSAKTGNYSMLTTVAATTFTSITGNGISGTWSATSIPAGIDIKGPITGFQLASGSVIAYNGAINS
jgi:hypothetical protein